jgi:flavin reductase (DIM6/NTAB) family NADH-FMN oxidoreductase RutF
MHTAVPLKVLYFGTPVVVISSLNPDGSTNLAPMSSAWWLGQDAMLGLAAGSQTTDNLLVRDECVLNLMPSSMAASVDQLALLTGSRAMPDYKMRQGYRYEPDKFTAAGLTPQSAEMIRPSRIQESPIQLECRIVARHPYTSSTATAFAFQATVVRAHVDEALVIPGTTYIDPVAWDPLIMKFCDFYGEATSVHPSRLATSWSMPNPWVQAGAGPAQRQAT